MTRVECHSGYKNAERPVAFWLEGTRREIESIFSAWITPDGQTFRVLTTDGADFELNYQLS
jgi:hypothetical protein